MMLLNTPNRPLLKTSTKDIWGLRFDGSDDYATLNWGSGMDPASTPMDFMVEVTVHDVGRNTMVFTTNTTGSSQRFYIGVHSGNWTVAIQGNSWDGTGAVPAVAGERVTLWMNFSGSTATLYVNGVETKSHSYTSYTFADDFYLASWEDGTQYMADCTFHHLTIRDNRNLDTFREFSFQEGSGTALIDRSNRASDGTILNGTTWTTTAQSPLPRGWYFESERQFKGRAKTGVLSSSCVGEFTAEIWARPDSIDSADAISGRIVTADTTFGSSRWAFGINSSSQVSAYADSKTESGSKMDLGRWYHLALTYDGSDVRVYVDGQLDFSFAATLPVDTYGYLTLGGRPANSDRFFGGGIMEARIWNHARSQAQIQGLKDWTLTGREKGLLGYYPQTTQPSIVSLIGADGSNPSTVSDYGPSGSDLTTVSGVATRKIGDEWALQFDGADDYAKATDDGVSSSSTRFYISAYIRQTQANDGTIHCAVHKGASGNSTVGSSDYWLGVSDDGYITATIGASNGVQWDSGKTSVQPQLDTWHFVEAYWDGVLVRVYVDREAKTSYDLDGYTKGDGPLRLGGSSDTGDYAYEGYVKEVKIVANNSLQVYYKLSERPLLDVSNNKAHGNTQLLTWSEAA